LIVIQPGTQEGAVALEHPESTRTMTPLAAMAATSRTRTTHPPDTADLTQDFMTDFGRAEYRFSDSWRSAFALRSAV
jgi:hypothetical protein